MSSIRSLSVLLCAFFSLLLGFRASAQDNPNLQNGIVPFGTYDGSDFDTVNLHSGNLALHIPLFDYPQRGSLSGRYMIVGNTKTFFVTQSCNPTLETCTLRWNNQPFLGPRITQVSDALGLQTPFRSTTANGLHVVSWDGSSHEMWGNMSLDASGISINNQFPPTVFLNKNGNGIPSSSGSVMEQDTNGNYFTGSLSSYTDTLGRTITTTSFPGPNGNPTQVQTTYGNVTIKTNFQASATDMYSITDPIAETSSHTVSVVQSIAVYDGFSWATSPTWTFQYNDRDPGDPSTINYGNITQITLPTGGTVSYTYRKFTMCGLTPLTPVSRGVSSRTVDANDGTGPHTTILGPLTTDPLGNDTVHSFTGLGGSCSFYETQTKYYQGSQTAGHLLKTVQTAYTYKNNPTNYSTTDGATTVVSVLPTTITTTLDNGMVSKVVNVWDHTTGTAYSYGNLLEKQEYDFGNGTPGPLVRKTDYTYLAFNNASYLTLNMLDRIASIIVYNGSGAQISQTTYGYDEASPVASGISTNHLSLPAGTLRGNRTSECHWLNTTGTNLCTHTTYYDTGMPYQVTDPLGHLMTYSYSSTYAGGYVTQTTLPQTGSVQHVVSGSYDFGTGKIATFTDQNSQVFHYYYDALGRMISAALPDGGQRTFSYPDLTTIETRRQIDSSRWTDVFVRFDGLGREIRRISANDEATPYDQVDTCYDVLGNRHFVTYPYQGTGLSASQCIKPGDTFTYDAIGRVLTVTHSDSSVVTTTYTGAATQVSDEGNGTRSIQRVSQVDGLGRLKSICETSSITLVVGLTPTPSACGQDIASTGFLTSYTYDALDNLKTVNQGGLNQRGFNYDSLSRLTSATNPESGTINYKYDSDTTCAAPNSFLGELISKTDARGIRTCMQYDALNRVTQKSYSDGTPTAGFFYDINPFWTTAAQNTMGHLVEAAVHTGPVNTSTLTSYDKMGRIAFQWEQAPSNYPGGYFLNYTYDLAGDMVTSSNVGGVTFSYNYNRASRLTSMTSSLTGTSFPGTLLSAVTYNSFGAPLTDTLGASAKTESRTYAPRGWLQGLSTLQGATQRYNFLLTFAPDGNILTANDGANGNWTYTYDDFNRLLSANATSQPYTYDYDRFGNRWHQNGPHSSSLGFDANNRIVSGSGVTYDAAGNVTADGSHTYTYDAENRLTTVDGGTTAQYVYDANGQRVTKTKGSSTVNYYYDLGGRPIDELSSTGTWNRGEVYAGGRHLATYSGGTSGTLYFVHADWLGTERSRVTYAGVPYETCTSLPFGDAQSCTATDPSPLHFTGKERDYESNLDNFGARYNSSSMGRFMSTDPTRLSVSPQNPQSWNRYSFASNNPLAFVDRNGKWSTLVHDEIIDYDFGSRLSAADRQIFKQASLFVDTDQSLQGAYKHGMRALDQPAWQAKYLGEGFISNQLDIAVNYQLDWEKTGHTGWSPGALFQFGQALHTVTDADSPWHNGWSAAWAYYWDPLDSLLHAGEEIAFGPYAHRAKVTAMLDANRLWVRWMMQLNDERRRREEEEERRQRRAAEQEKNLE